MERSSGTPPSSGPGAIRQRFFLAPFCGEGETGAVFSLCRQTRCVLFPAAFLPKPALPFPSFFTLGRFLLERTTCRFHSSYFSSSSDKIGVLSPSAGVPVQNMSSFPFFLDLVGPVLTWSAVRPLYDQIPPFCGFVDGPFPSFSHLSLSSFFVVKDFPDKGGGSFLFLFFSFLTSPDAPAKQDFSFFRREKRRCRFLREVLPSFFPSVFTMRN